MNQPTHIIDPDGEVMINLRNANAPFAPWGDEAMLSRMNKEEAIEQPAENGVVSEKVKKETDDKINEKNGEEEQHFRIRVSAKHLTLASPVFKKQLTGAWEESVTYQKKGCVEINTEEWDIDAFLLMLRIIHCQFKKISKKLPVEMLAKILVIIDYYECNESMEFFTTMWLQNLEASKADEDYRPSTYGRDLILWLWIAWFYVLPGLFQDVTSTAMSQSKQDITNLGLPIPEKVIRVMNDRRSEAINNAISNIHEKREAFLNETLGCGSECSSIMYGALSKAMKSKGLLSPKPVAPFAGLNYQELVETVKAFESPHWYSKSHSRAHWCEDSSFETLFEELEKTIDGLQLSDHVAHIPWVMDI